MKKSVYEKRLRELQIELVNLQEWIKNSRTKSCGYFRGSRWQQVKAVQLKELLKL